MTHVAFLGTGLLGSAMIEAAAKRGDLVVAWNRTLEKARVLEAHGVTVAKTPADAVRGAVRVHLVLKDDDSVESVIAEMRPGLRPQTIVVDHTTTQPARTAERVRRLNSEGVRYIHCPVFIGPAAARKSEGTILSSGPRALFDEIQPALSKMAERVEYLGERPDLAAVFKLCGNAYIIGTSGLIADVFAIASSADVPSATVANVFDFLNPAAILAGRAKNMERRNYTPSFELLMARKDLRLMLETSTRPLAMLPGLAARMDALIEEGHAGDDLAIVGKDSVSGSS